MKQGNAVQNIFLQQSKENYKAAIITVLFITIFSSSVYQSTGNQASFIVANFLILVAYLCFSNSYTIRRYQLAFFVFICLYLYSFFFSVLVARSSIVAACMMASFMFFCTLNDLVQQRHASISKKGEEVNNTTVNKHFDYLTLAKFALATVIGVNALVLIALYMVHPVRGTGLFKDFSQSAFSIMLAFALVQPLIKDKIIATPITLIFFLGFFITFSRTANFLLFIYLVALFVIEYRNNRSRHFLKIIALIGLSYLLVQIYPLTIDQTTVNRGFSDITTLNSRTSYWSAAWQAIIQSPLTGYGFHTYEFTGVKTLLPYRKITNIHNDYLQVWHDLGALWLLFFIAVITTAAIKFCPLSFSLSPRARVQIKQTSDKKQIAWVLLMCMFAYMLINFILLSTLFQVVFVLIITELLKNEPA